MRAHLCLYILRACTAKQAAAAAVGCKVLPSSDQAVPISLSSPAARQCNWPGEAAGHTVQAPMCYALPVVEWPTPNACMRPLRVGPSLAPGCGFRLA